MPQKIPIFTDTDPQGICIIFSDTVFFNPTDTDTPKIPIFTDTDPPSLTGTNITLLGINLGGLIKIYSIMNNN